MASSLNQTEIVRARRIEMLAPGMVLLKDRIPMSLQREIVDNCIEFGEGRVPQVGGFHDGKINTDKVSGVE